MAIILPFVPRKRGPSRSSAFGPASIVIFPGVRYERGGSKDRSGLPQIQRESRPKRPNKPSPIHI